MPTALDPQTYAAITALVIEVLRWVPVVALGMGRPVGLLLILPVFTRAEMGTMVRLTFALTLTLPVVGAFQRSLGPGEIPVMQLTGLGLKELFVGFLIGFLLGAPFWVLSAVGELIDSQRGNSNPAGPNDPSTKSQSSALGLLLGLLAITMFVAAGGLNAVVEVLYGSYALWPIGHALPNTDIAAMTEVGRVVDRIMRMAVLIAGPVIALMLLLDLCAALLGRFASQLQLNDLAPTLKNVAAVLFLLVYVNALFAYVGAEVATTRTLAARLGQFLR
ncbi:type III secretion system export apparatus subunit SctT [Methylobacterium sp. J-076]|uniref:type III secretion system export apparatus subunit SctT n=1 Tax=Methylobacterium sp. J-076 TaxID=2836655 RepID=UPI001FBB0A9C|nr:type III secretion system export apparatus subunit SctT [Methylobacterium sp. J-076]MCJ2013133.1 type III secretion system export apparatus subunit SctT [Methylobacterium sp. J-076]